MRFSHETTVIPTLLLVAGCATAPGAGPSGGAGPAGAGIPFDWEFRGLDPVARGRSGMVVTADSRATRVGLDVLQSGGNAVDAAVAVGFALAVVHPRAGNIGGGGFMVIRMADGEVAALDFRETAPLAATPERYLDMEGNVTDEIERGHKSVGVPGTVKGLAEAHARRGSLAWEDLLAPAIDLAEGGFTVTAELHEDLSSKQSLLERYESSRQVFLPGGSPPSIGTRFRQPDLGRTLREIAAEGSAPFYRGRIAELIVQEMQRGDGLLTYEDLSRYRAVWRDPIVFDYRGYPVISMSPPSSGGVTLAEILNILEGYNLSSLGFGTPETIHLIAEASRRAFADRNYFLGDPDYSQAPIERLTSDDYAAEQRSTISRSRASESEFFNRVPIQDGANTTHYSIVDSQGNAVAVTYTINSFFGSGVVVRGAGFFLNNEMDDFTVRPGVANQFDLIQGDENLVGPGRRPLSSMTPTIVLDPNGALLMVLGSPGGPRIITALAQTIINVVDFDMNARAAVDAPRVHHQLWPDEIRFETKGVEARTLGQLAAMGHEIIPNAGYFGAVQLILRDVDGELVGAADPRFEGGRALGY